MSESKPFTDAMLIRHEERVSSQSSPKDIDVTEAMLWGYIPEDEFFLGSEALTQPLTVGPVQV